MPLALLRRRMAVIEGQHRRVEPMLAATGHAGIDAALGGGLARGRLHELYAHEPDDASSTAGFAAMLALMLAANSSAVGAPGGAIVWLRQDQAQRRGGGLYAPGLVDIGLDPARLIVGVLADPLAMLRAAAEVVRCQEVAVAVIELWQRPRELDLTASRRLAIATEHSGVSALMLRVDADPTPSAAWTRWQVAAAPSAALEANAPGHPALDIRLVRQRSRPAEGRWQVEWDREAGIFRDGGSIADRGATALPGSGQAALPRTAVPLPPRQPAGNRRRVA